MIEIKRERLEQVEEDIKPLLIEHWEEIASYKAQVKLEPNWAKYKALEMAGALVAITARRDGKLVGYSVFQVTNHLHYDSCRMAMNDVLFLTKGERNGGTGVRLIRESERVLKELGVMRIMFHSKPDHDISPLMKRLGYRVEEIMLGKLLE